MGPGRSHLYHYIVYCLHAHLQEINWKIYYYSNFQQTLLHEIPTGHLQKLLIVFFYNSASQTFLCHGSVYFLFKVAGASWPKTTWVPKVTHWNMKNRWLRKIICRPTIIDGSQTGAGPRTTVLRSTALLYFLHILSANQLMKTCNLLNLKL